MHVFYVGVRQLQAVALSGWRGAWLLLLWVLMLGPVVGAAQAEPVATPVRELQEAEFQLNTTRPWEPVTLPDTWARRNVPVNGSGRYRLRFTLSEVPPYAMAVRFDRISASRRVALNGQLLEEPLAVSQEQVTSAVIELPWQQLRVGDNTLEIDQRYRSRAGLSVVSLGRASELRVIQGQVSALTRELPRSLNMGFAVLGAFMIFIWWRRRSEAALGLFGTLAVLSSLRNYIYFADIPLFSAALTDWMYFSVHIWVSILFFAFARSLGPVRQGKHINRALWLAAIAVPLLAALPPPWSMLGLLRVYAYPVFFVLICAAVVLASRAVRARADALHLALLISFALVLMAALHDYLFQQGVFPVTHALLVPYVMPLGLGTYGAMLMARLVTALGQVEQLNTQLEDRVQQRTSALQSANAAKTRFLASASHDLRQPVAAIGLLVSLLREQINAPRLRRMIERVDDSVAAMETMLKGLLDLSRFETGAIQARIEPLALQPLFDAIALHEGETAAQKGLRLHFRPTPLAVQADAVLLEQALRNLVSNAVRYTERGGVLVCARARAGGHVLLQVWDTGVGIAPEDQAKVFDEFVQIGNEARERSRGLGLGLAIVQRSLRAMGVSLTLRSRLGQGSCFGVMLSRAQQTPSVAPAVAPLSPPVAPLKGRRIMLIEDDPAVRESLFERLSAWGAFVHTCGSVDAFRQLLEVTFVMDCCDLLITDQRLPGGSGLQAIALARTEHGAVRALVITGDTAAEDLAQLTAHGLPVLHKPFRTDALLAAIEAALQTTPRM